MWLLMFWQISYFVHDMPIHFANLMPIVRKCNNIIYCKRNHFLYVVDTLEWQNSILNQGGNSEKQHALALTASPTDCLNIIINSNLWIFIHCVLCNHECTVVVVMYTVTIFVTISFYDLCYHSIFVHWIHALSCADTQPKLNTFYYWCSAYHTCIHYS